MAIYTTTGKPRSGKSYWITHKLYLLFVAPRPKRSFLFGFFYKHINRFITKKNRKKFISILRHLFEPKKKVHYYAYVNVKGFDFTKTSRIKPLVFEELYTHLEYLHAMYLSKSTDDVLIEYAKMHNLYKVIFVIDECQDYFEKKDKVLMWWFAYHGHLFHDIYILTQNLGQIYEEYFKFSEFYFRAIPPSNRLLSSQFRYMQFNSHKLFKTERIASYNVPALQEVYDMYKSGDDNFSQSFVKKYFFIAIFIFMLLIVGFIFFLSQFSTPKTVSNDENITISKQENKVFENHHKQKNSIPQKVVKEDDNKTLLFDIRCVDMLCNYKDTDFPKPLLNKLINKTTPDFVWFFNNGSYIQYFVMLPKDTFDFLEVKEKKEKGAKNVTKDKEALKNPVARAIVPTK